MNNQAPIHAEKPFRSGYVALIGRPNAGKSTLLNVLVGEKVAITAHQPQTTRTAIEGILTTATMQAVFVDTPGVHEPKGLIQERMLQSVQEALSDCDVTLLLADSTRKPSEEDERIAGRLPGNKTASFLVLTKTDLLTEKAQLLPTIEWYAKRSSFREIFPISARKGNGLDALKKSIEEALPRENRLFPEDFVTTQPVRFMAAEIIREKILHATREEVPHAAAVRVEQWEENGTLVSISADIYVERAGQRVILLGSKGAMLKKIGTAARMELERLLGRKVHLALFVKVQPGWREDPHFLRSIDWRAMLGSDTSV